MKNKIEDLRDHLFATLEELRDDQKPMDIKRALAVSQVAGTIIESAKVEVAFLNVTGAKQGTGFIPVEDRRPKPLQPINPRLVKSST